MYFFMVIEYNLPKNYKDYNDFISKNHYSYYFNIIKLLTIHPDCH